jgi:transcriptional antiterminator RfaH
MTMSIFVPGWCLIYTRPNQERKIVQRLYQKGLESYLPMTKVIRQWHDRKRIVEIPLFPSYVFVNLTKLLDLYSSAAVEGFVSYVKVGGTIARVSQALIDNIQLTLIGGEKVEVSASRFEAGEKLQIEHGPLAGLQCELVQYNGRQKALIRINLLSRNIIADIPTSYLRVRTGAS